ncbi:MAG: hypothetical protein NZO16_00800 [Deltaproteobacteria bacterium]|nr:hypothetical protein [Deltaproteobacteria bacterium]
MVEIKLDPNSRSQSVGESLQNVPQSNRDLAEGFLSKPTNNPKPEVSNGGTYEVPHNQQAHLFLNTLGLSPQGTVGVEYNPSPGNTVSFTLNPCNHPQRAMDLKGMLILAKGAGIEIQS